MRNLKRALSLALALVMVLSMMVVGAGAVSIDDFTDADEIVNTEAVTTMVSLGVIDGNDDGSYNPTGVVKRGEMAKLIAVMLNGGSDPTLGETPVVFADTAGHWAQNYISYVANLHIIDGRGDGTFGPNDDVTGSEAAKMLLTALGYRSDLEGFTGANWAINVQAMANQVELFEGLTINPDEGLSRDNTAQMLYNAVQADMVEYRNLEGSYDGIVYPQPINGVSNDSTVLYERFHVRKVTGILEANDKVSVAGTFGENASFRAGHDAGSVALDGQSLLYVTDVSGYSYDRTWNVNTNSYYNNLYGAATYKVDTSDDMVGQEIVIYVRYENDLSPNAANATVIGTPILTENNTVVETNTRLKDEAAVRSALRAGGLTNIGHPAAFLYTEEYVDGANGVDTGITDTIAARFHGTADQDGDGDAENLRSAGIVQRFIDNDGDGYPNFILQVAPVLSAVNSVNSAGDQYTFTGISDTIDVDDIVTEEALERNDVVLLNQYADGRYYVTFPDVVEGAVESYNSNNYTVSVDGTSYGNSGGKNLGVAGTDWLLREEMVENTYRFYLDDAGNVLGHIETDTIIGNYAVVQGYSVDGNSNMGYTARVKLLLQDGSSATYDVNLATSAVRLGLINADASNSAKEAAATDAGWFEPEATYSAATTQLVNHLFSYSLDGDTVTLMNPQEVNSDRYRSRMLAGAETDIRYNEPEYNTISGYNDDGTEIAAETVVANDRTVFFIKDWDRNDNSSDWFVVVGLGNMPTTPTSIGDAIDTDNNTANGAEHAVTNVIAYQAPGDDTWVARAIFLTTDAEFVSSRDFVFVTDKWITRTVSGTPVYDFTVVNRNGETSTMTTTDDTNTLKNTVREYYKDGSYYAFVGGASVTQDGVYVKTIDGNTITLHTISGDAYVGSYRVDSGADIWDVQDEPVEDSLQVNDKVAVKLDENVVEAAFIYGVTNGNFAQEPGNSDIKVGGVNFGGTANLTVGDTLTLSITLDNASQSLSNVSLVRDSDGKVISFTMKRTDDANSYTYSGSYTVTASDTGTYDLRLTIAQSGLDSKTVTYNDAITLAVGQVGSDLTVDSPVSDINAALVELANDNDATNNTLTLNGIFAPNGKITVPDGMTLEVSGFNPTVLPETQGTGKIVVTGNSRLPGGNFIGNLEVGRNLTLKGDLYVDGSLTVGTEGTTNGNLDLNGFDLSGSADTTVRVWGNTDFGSSIGAQGGGFTFITTTVTVTGSFTLAGGNVNVTGDITTNGGTAVAITGGTFTVEGTVEADLTISGDASVTTGTIIGDVTVSGSAEVSIPSINGNYTQDAGFTGTSDVTANDVTGEYTTGEVVVTPVEAAPLVARLSDGTDVTGSSEYIVPSVGTASASTTAGDGVVNVALTVTDLQKHYNGAGTTGRWFGITVPAANGDQYAWGWGSYDPSTTYSFTTLTKDDSTAEEGFYRNYDATDRNGATSFYVIVKKAAAAGAEAVTTVYQVNFTVTTAGGDTVAVPYRDLSDLAAAVEAAPIVARTADGDDVRGDGSYTVPDVGQATAAATADSANGIINVNLTVTGLQKHYNAPQSEGRWFGILISAENSDQYYLGWGTYDPSVDYSLNSLSGVVGGEEGFYRNWDDTARDGRSTYFVIHESGGQRVVYQITCDVTTAGDDTAVVPTQNTGAGG